MVKFGMMPTTRHTTTRSSMGKRIQCGGSFGVRGSVGGGPKNTSRINRKE